MKVSHTSTPQLTIWFIMCLTNMYMNFPWIIYLVKLIGRKTTVFRRYRQESEGARTLDPPVSEIE